MSNTIRILLVEDDDADAEMIRAVLRQGGLPFILRHAQMSQISRANCSNTPWM
jgi:hypothetical protein